jgi:hypothetical protein
MSANYWAFLSASWLMTAVAPWSQPSYSHSWFDAMFYGMATFGAIKAITSAVASAQGKSK